MIVPVYMFKPNKHWNRVSEQAYLTLKAAGYGIDMLYATEEDDGR